MLRKCHLAAAITATLLLTTTVHAKTQAPFDNVVVFGDSLSDAGQLFSTSLNSYSKFTTNPGDVVVQIVTQNYGFELQPSRTGSSDSAYGGSGVITDDDGPILPFRPSPSRSTAIRATLQKPIRAASTWSGAEPTIFSITPRNTA